jgi:hypothetical protein
MAAQQTVREVLESYGWKYPKRLKHILVKQDRVVELNPRYRRSQATFQNILELEELARGKCMICGGLQVGNRKLGIDHCHQSGKLRGVLCNRCNAGLGSFMDNPALLEVAIIYLKKHG